MRAVVQRVSQASVEVGGEQTASIGRGFVVLLGVAREDSERDAEYLADKIAGLRVFEDPQGKLNLGLSDVGGELLVVSQFTLLGDCRKGRRPSFAHAAEPEQAERLYLLFARRVEQQGIKVKTGRFRELMDIKLVNHGPVTLLLDSNKQF